MLTLCCTPDPALSLQGIAESSFERQLATVWPGSSSDGLVLLATEGMTIELDASLVWLRHWSRQCFARLCQTRSFEASLAPDPAATHLHLANLPAFPGAEYVTPDLLSNAWTTLLAHIRTDSSDDLEGWLRTHGNAWHLVGRVTFHLAENKRDTERPFAFLATFAEQLSASGQVQHLPLARALQQSSAQQDHPAVRALLQPVRRAAERIPWIEELLSSRRLFQALAWTPAEAYRLVRDLNALQDCGLVVKVPDWWRGGRPARPTVTVTIDAENQARVGVGALLSFSVAVSMNGEPLTPAELEKIKNSTSGLVSLRGQWVEIDPAKLGQVLAHWNRVERLHADGQLTFHQGMRYLAGFGSGPAMIQESGLTEVQTAEWSQVIAGKNFAQLLNHLRSPGLAEPPPDLQATLRPYQLQGLAWLRFMHRLGLGACLADDMGLGKTLQVIATLLSLHPSKPSLVVAPASLIGSWRSELIRFAPTLRFFIAHRSAASREDLQALDHHPGTVLGSIDLVVTTYTHLTRSDALLLHSWNLVIIDEAQAIKNSGTIQARAVKQLKAHARIALTGTPVENRPGDLWSLFDFLNPGLLGSPSQFTETLKRLNGACAPLRKLVQPYLLRRMKTDRSIISDLPEKIEVKTLCPLTRRQATIYTRLVEELKRTLADPKLQPFERSGLVLGFLLKFKQVCNHPSHWSGDGQYKPADSGKFQRLTAISEEIAQRQERAIIFTQFAEMCDPLAHHLASSFGRPGLVLHGGTPVAQRSRLVEQFQSPDGPPFFVISVKAGGTGLTLTRASHVIHFDRWWNPAIENQATDRAFRIGQKKNVLVHKFVVPGTIEDRIDRLIEEKKTLADELLGSSTGAESQISRLNNDELLRLVALDISTIDD